MIVVVGGAGYIGSVTVEELVNRGEDVLVIDDLSLGHEWAIPDEVEFVETDMSDKGAIRSIAEGHDIQAVMHFAALAKVGESMENPRRYWKQNVLKSIRMVEAWIDNGVTNFIFSSSAATYGEPEAIPITEDHPTDPINPYGRTKRAVEWYLEDLFQNDDVQSVSLRYFNAAGAGSDVGEDHDPETHLIPIILEVVAGDRQCMEIYGTDYDTRDGTCLRDFVHVRDLADAHVRALDRIDSIGCDRIDLGTGTGQTVNEVIETVESVTGKSVDTEHGSRRRGDPAKLVSCYNKARQLLNWTPKRDLTDIIEDAWRFHRQHSTDG